MMRALVALIGVAVCLLYVSVAFAQAEKTGNVQFTLVVVTQQRMQHPASASGKKHAAEDVQNTVEEVQRCFRDTVKQISKKATVQGITARITDGGSTFRGNFTAEGIAPDSKAVCEIYTVLSALQNLPGVDSCHITVETHIKTVVEDKR
jgi:hypothetical protein